MYRDLRDWMELVDELGEFKRINGANWNLEIGAITELMRKKDKPPALLFDHVPGFEPGFRILANPLHTLNRVAVTTGMPTHRTKKEYVDLWKDKTTTVKRIPPVYVNDGPVMENHWSGSEINLNKFPVPFWHEKDGGRYIGTGSVNITTGPGENWANLGVYRVMVLDERRVFFYVSPGKHGAIHRQKWFDLGKPCPIVISVGHDPLLYIVGSTEVPYGSSELDLAGGLKGEPIEVIKGLSTGLPIPARAEIVLEGHAYPGTGEIEGPFGEWTGYYGSSARAEPVVEVEHVYFRNHPIILGNPPSRPPYSLGSAAGNLMRAANIRNELEKAGITDVVDVWPHEVGSTRLFVAVSIKQRYAGHARQAAMLAGFCHAGAYLGRIIVVVDDDVDVFDLNDVMWAVCTRCDPERGVEIIKRCWSGPLDPAIPKGQKGLSSRLIIDACRPYEWKDQFPEAVSISKELKDATMAKWGAELGLQ